MSEKGVHLILSTLAEHFRYIDLRLLGHSYYMATCSDQPIRVRSFHELPHREMYEGLLQMGLRGLVLDEFFTDIRISPNLLRGYHPKDSILNRDDHPILEFELVRSYQRREMGKDMFVYQQELFNIDPLRLQERLGAERMARRAAMFRRLNPGFLSPERRR
jgi:hypothetical protein